MASGLNNAVSAQSTKGMPRLAPALRRLSVACGLMAFLGSPQGQLGLGESAHGQTAATQEHKKASQEFVDSGGGRGFTENGIPVSFHWYKSPDGVTVTTCVETYESEASAKKGLEKRIKRAVKIIRQWPKKDRSGRLVGERVLVELRPDDEGRKFKALYWTLGKYVHCIMSQSESHLMEFEKAHDP